MLRARLNYSRSVRDDTAYLLPRPSRFKNQIVVRRSYDNFSLLLSYSWKWLFVVLFLVFDNAQCATATKRIIWDDARLNTIRINRWLHRLTRMVGVFFKKNKYITYYSYYWSLYGFRHISSITLRSIIFIQRGESSSVAWKIIIHL